MAKFKKGMTPWNKGIPRTEEEKRKLSIARKGKRNFLVAGEKNYNWKKDRNIGYRQRHRQMAKELGEKPSQCPKCNIEPGLTKDGKNKIQWSNISGEYKLEVSDWQALCISCHKKYDKIIDNFKGLTPWQANRIS